MESTTSWISAMTETLRDGRTLEIRRWRKEDLPSVQKLSWLTWKATYGLFIPEADMRVYHDEHYSLDALERNYLLSRVRGFIAFVSDEPSAYMLMSLESEKRRCSISSLYVAPVCQNLGVGSHLMQEAEQVASGAAFDRMWLGVMKSNQRAIDWYVKCGFHFEREEPFTMGGTTVIHLIGYKLLKVMAARRSAS